MNATICPLVFLSNRQYNNPLQYQEIYCGCSLFWLIGVFGLSLWSSVIMFADDTPYFIYLVWHVLLNVLGVHVDMWTHLTIQFFVCKTSAGLQLLLVKATGSHCE